MAAALPSARPRTLAALLLAAYAVVHGSSTPTATTTIPFGVTGHSSASEATGERSTNAALRPQELPSTASLEHVIELLLNKTADNRSIVNPFARAPTPTPTVPATTSSPSPSPSSPSPSPSASSTPSDASPRAPTSPSTTGTPEPTSESSAAEPLTDEFMDIHGSHSGSGSMKDHWRSGRRVGPTSAPTPIPLDDWEELSESPAPSATGTIKRTNMIAFDVVTPQATAADDENTTNEPSPSQPATPTKPVAPTPGIPSAAPKAPSAAPSAQPGPPPPGVTAPAVPASQTPASTSATPKPSSSSTAPPTPSSSSPTEPRSTSIVPGQPKVTGEQSTAALGDGAPSNKNTGPVGHASSSHDDSTVGQTAKSQKASPPPDAAGSGSASVESSTESEGASSYYSMGTTSILSIVGVIVGICVIIGLFVLISRREYEDDDDDRDVLGYGGDGGFKTGDRPSIMRLSPTFLMNGAGPAVPGQPVEPDFSLPSPLQIMGSNRGVGSNRGYAPARAVGEDSPAIMERSMPVRTEAPSNEGGPSPSAFQSSDDISTLDSRGSDGWSSVMESDFDVRGASRCTRDTTFSNITVSQNLSELNAWDLTSQARVGSGRGTYRTTSRRTGGRGTRSAPTMPEYDLDERDDDSSSVLSYDVDSAAHNNKTGAVNAFGGDARSTGFSSYRSSSESQFSDYRSTSGFDSSR